MNYIKCPNCGEEIPDYSMFCEMCGYKINNNYQSQSDYTTNTIFCSSCGGNVVNGVCSVCGAQFNTYNNYQQNMQYNDGQQYDYNWQYSYSQQQDNYQQYVYGQEYNNEMTDYGYNQGNMSVEDVPQAAQMEEYKPLYDMLQVEQTEDYKSLDDMVQAEQVEDYKPFDDMVLAEQAEDYKPLDDMAKAEQAEDYKPLDDIVEQKEQVFESIIDENNIVSQAAPLNSIDDNSYAEIAATKDNTMIYKEIIDFSDSALATGLPEWTIEAPMIVVRKKGKQ